MKLKKRKSKKNPEYSIVYKYGNVRGLIHQLKILAGIGDSTDIKMNIPSKREFEDELKDFMEGFIKGMEEAKIEYKLIPRNKIKNYIQDLTDESLVLEFEIRQYEKIQKIRNY